VSNAILDSLDALLEVLELDHQKAARLEERNPVLFRGATGKALLHLHMVSAIRDDVLHDMHREAV
jgi:hypothetical protein